MSPARREWQVAEAVGENMSGPHFRKMIAQRRAFPQDDLMSAVVAVAHSVLVIIYQVLRDKQPYTDLGADYARQDRYQEGGAASHSPVGTTRLYCVVDSQGGSLTSSGDIFEGTSTRGKVELLLASLLLFRYPLPGNYPVAGIALQAMLLFQGSKMRF